MKQLPISAKSSAAPVAAAGGLSLAKPLIAAIVAMSLMLLAAAAIPATVVPWRPVARFIHQRHLDLTLSGIVLLAAAGVAILLTRGY